MKFETPKKSFVEKDTEEDPIEIMRKAQVGDIESDLGEEIIKDDEYEIMDDRVDIETTENEDPIKMMQEAQLRKTEPYLGEEIFNYKKNHSVEELLQQEQMPSKDEFLETKLPFCVDGGLMVDTNPDLRYKPPQFGTSPQGYYIEKKGIVRKKYLVKNKEGGVVDKFSNPQQAEDFLEKGRVEKIRQDLIEIWKKVYGGKEPI